jgi:hypothetical protein
VSCPSEAPQAKKAETEKSLAERWGCDVRTIRRWRKAGAPLAGDAAMRTWLLGRAKVPAGTAAILAAKPGGARAVPPPADKPKAKVRPMPARPAGEPVPEGAPEALKRLAGEEARQWTRLRDMEADPEADPEEIEKVRKNWHRAGGSLRAYDLAIENSRRDAGLLVPRKELEDYAKGLVVHFVGSVYATLEMAAPRLAGLPGPGEVWQVLDPLLAEAVKLAVEHTAARPYGGRIAPKWLMEAIEAALEAHLCLVIAPEAPPAA